MMPSIPSVVTQSFSQLQMLRHHTIEKNGEGILFILLSFQEPCALCINLIEQKVVHELGCHDLEKNAQQSRFKIYSSRRCILWRCQRQPFN